MPTNSLPMQNSQQEMPLLVPEQPAPASRRQVRRRPQRSRHPVPAGWADTSLISQHRAADGRGLQDFLRYTLTTLNKLTPWLLSLSWKAKHIFPLGREQDEFQTNLLIQPITHPPNHPPNHLIIQLSMHPSIYPPSLHLSILYQSIQSSPSTHPPTTQAYIHLSPYVTIHP